MERAASGVAVDFPQRSWAGIEDVAWDELLARHGLPADRRTLREELRRGRRDRRGEIMRMLTGRSKRRSETVGDIYERVYRQSNAEFVAGRAERSDAFLVDGAPVRVDGWFTYAYRVELLDRVLARCGGETVLEVGAGRGILLALLVLRHPERDFVGLELTAAGVARGEELMRELPAELVRLNGQEETTPEQAAALTRAGFVQGDATALPFENDSFDVSYTCLALEQMPRVASEAIREIARVTRHYCVFIEPFAEANGPLGLAELRALDYFRGSYRRLPALGLEPVYFTKSIPQKLRFNKGLLVARVAR